MKKILLKEVIVELAPDAQVPENYNPEEHKLSYRKQLLVISKNPLNPQGGMQYEEIKQVDRLVEVLTGEGDFVIMEDTDFTNLCERVKKYPYAMYVPEISQFTTDILGSEDHKVKE